jgi:hypothetical protein
MAYVTLHEETNEWYLDPNPSGEEVGYDTNGKVISPIGYKNQIEAELAELAPTQYQRDRVAAYPAIQDQLDDIYHNGVAGWKATIKAIKDAHPKPV